MSALTAQPTKKFVGKKSDTQLVKDCLGGSEEAWAELIDKYKALIYSIPVKYELPHQEAADVFQSVCMELLKRLPELRQPRALPKWLMQVTHHECLRVKRMSLRIVSSDETDETSRPEMPPMAERLVREIEQEQMLRDALAHLSPQCQRLVQALFLETPARPYSEIAAELGLALGSIGFIRQKCIERLRRRLQLMGFM